MYTTKSLLVLLVDHHDAQARPGQYTFAKLCDFVCKFYLGVFFGHVHRIDDIELLRDASGDDV